MKKKCDPIIISNCPDKETCEGCTEIISTECVKYFGENLEILGINNGDTLTTILTKLETFLTP